MPEPLKVAVEAEIMGLMVCLLSPGLGLVQGLKK
jgi:hypothetical protein